MTGLQQQRNPSSIIIKPNVSDLAISKMQNITPIMKSPYKLMISCYVLVLLKNDIGLFTSGIKGFTMTSINNIITFKYYSAETLNHPETIREGGIIYS